MLLEILNIGQSSRALWDTKANMFLELRDQSPKFFRIIKTVHSEFSPEVVSVKHDCHGQGFVGSFLHTFLLSEHKKAEVAWFILAVASSRTFESVREIKYIFCKEDTTSLKLNYPCLQVKDLVLLSDI